MPDRELTEPLTVSTPSGNLAVTRVHPQPGAGHRPGVLMFLHPVNLDSRCWLPMTNCLQGPTCVLMDSRGHGRSHQHGPFGVDDYAADVRAVIEELSLEHLHLVGASLGGSIACAVAAQLPEQVRSLTAFGASLEPAEPEVLDALRRWREQVGVEGLFDDFLRQEIQHGLPERVAADARSQIGFDSRAPALIHEITYRAFAEDARHHAAKVRCPALLLTGEHDESCPPGAGARTAEALRGHFEILGGLGHFPMMQAPKNMAARLMQFIEGATPR